MKKKLLFLICLITLILGSNTGALAQNLSVTEIPPSNMTLGLGNFTFSLKIKNNTPSVLQDMLIDVKLPDYVNFTGNLTNASLVETTDPGSWVFGVSQLLPYDSLLISYQAEAACQIISNLVNNVLIQNKYLISYNREGETFSETHILQSYNILYANLFVTVSDIDSPLYTGDHFGLENQGDTRNITITNGGNGAIDTVILLLEPENEIRYNALFSYFDGTNLEMSANGNELRLILYGELLQRASDQTGPDPYLFEPGESIRMIEDFTVLECSLNPNQNTNYQVQWSCLEIPGMDNNTSTTSNITVLTGTPNIASQVLQGSTVEKMANYCGLDTNFTFLFINTASLSKSNIATNLVLDIISTQDYTSFPYSFELSAFKINGVDLNNEPIFYSSNALRWPHSFDNVPDGNTDNYADAHGFVIDLSTNTNPDLGIEDLDGDLKFDDLYPGDTIVVTCSFRFLNDSTFYSECPLQYHAIFGKPQARWSNNCETMTMGSSGKQSQYIAYVSGGSDADIVEPVDFIEGNTEVFKFCTGTFEQDLDFLNCPLDSTYALLYLPDGYELALGDLALYENSILWIPSKKSTLQADTVLLTAQQNGSEVTIFGGGKDRYWNGCYEVPLRLNCSLVASGIPAVSTISWELRYLCDTCNVEQTRTCFSQNVFNHTSCSSSNSGGAIVSKDLEIKRTTFGWTDLNMTQRVTENTPDVKLNAAYPYDTLKATISGKINSLNLTQLAAELYYPFNDPNPHFSVISGVFKIYTPGQTTSPTFHVGENLSSSADGIHTIRFGLPSTAINTLNIGDSIVLQLALSVNLSPFVIQQNYYEIPNLRSQFNYYSGNEWKTSDSWGERFFLYSAETRLRAKAEPDGCNDVKITLSTLHHGGILGDDFPNEFRPLIRINPELKFTIPAGYTFNGMPGTAYFYNADGPAYSIDHTESVMPVQSGNQLLFTHNWPYLDKGGHVNLQFTPPVFEFYLTPDCDRNDTFNTRLEYQYDEYYYTRNSNYFIHWKWNEGSGINSYITEGIDTFNINTFNYKPNISATIISAYQQIAYSQNTYWDVLICNQPDVNHPIVSEASKVWFDIDELAGNSGGILIENVQQLGTLSPATITYYNEGKSSFVALEALPANECRTYRLTISYTNCDDTLTDTLRLLSGWDCRFYPDPLSVENSTCQLGSEQLVVSYQSADLQLASFSLPEGQFELFDTLHYEFLLTSAAPANMYDVDFWLNLPEGTQVSNPKYAYPITNSWFPLPAPTSFYTGNNPAGWSLDSLVFLGFNYAFIGSRETDLNNLRISFDLVTDCAFDPTQALIVNADGLTNCKKEIQLTSAYFLPVSGQESSYSYLLSSNIPDTLFCGDNRILSFSVKNNGDINSQPGDSLQIFLPGGISYLPDCVACGHASFKNQKISLPINILKPDSSQTFSFRINADSFSSCSEILFRTQIRQTPSLCGNHSSTTDEDTIKRILCCNSCKLDASFRTGKACVGKEMCPELIDPSMLQYQHQWDFGDGTTATGAQVCHQYIRSGIYTLTHLVTSPDGCSDTISMLQIVESCVEVGVRPNPTIHQHTTVYFSSLGQNLLPTKIKIYNLWGDHVHTQELNPGEETSDLDFTKYAPGIYFVTLMSDEFILHSEKVLVIH